MRPNNTDSLITAAHRRRELTRAKAIQTIRELDHAGTPVTFQAIARASQVSRSWLYSQPDIRAEIERLRDATQQTPSPPIPTSQRASDPSLRQRLTEATQRNRQLAEDNARLRRQLAHALGDQRASPPALNPLPRGDTTGHSSITKRPC
jgi:small-conductance mechanosensitive channel